jgi:hypothetical protein
MQTSQLRLIGFWCGVVLVALGITYIGLIAIMILSGTGFPPSEPFQTVFNALILLTAAWMVVFWTIMNYIVPAEKKLFSQVSLAMIVIFTTLTSINRYVGLTVVKQSLMSGNTSGLQWFLPYSWPSVMMAIEFLAWGFFFGLACLFLAPAFRTRSLGNTIFWFLIATGLLSLSAAVGQVTGANAINFNPFMLLGMLAWGPGFTITTILITMWFKKDPNSVT